MAVGLLFTSLVSIISLPTKKHSGLEFQFMAMVRGTPRFNFITFPLVPVSVFLDLLCNHSSSLINAHYRAYYCTNAKGFQANIPGGQFVTEHPQVP
jgi:hypothetical protein